MKVFVTVGLQAKLIKSKIHSMRILIVSWRDIKHPYGGGAEDLSHQMARRWVSAGHEVTHFSALFPGGKSEEVIDDVKYLREGNWYNVHIIAFLKYISGTLRGFDVVIDEVHGIPFFAKYYTGVPVVCLACEVAKDIWDRMYMFPINLLGRFLENIYLATYRDVPFLTISESTLRELAKNGIPEKNITVVPMGFSYSLPKSLPKKSNAPSIIFLGRLVKTKGIEDALSAFAKIVQELPNAQMSVVGRGIPEYENYLKELVKKLGLEKKILFRGFVSNDEKFNLLASAHLILVPSSHEGWGLIVPEANIVGTPAIVYDVAGLRDVTKNGRNGVVVQPGVDNLAQAALKLLGDKAGYKKLSESSLKFAKSMSWDDTARVGLEVIKKAVKNS